MLPAWSSHLEDRIAGLGHGLEVAPRLWFLAEQRQGGEAASFFSS